MGSWSRDDANESHRRRRNVSPANRSRLVSFCCRAIRSRRADERGKRRLDKLSVISEIVFISRGPIVPAPRHLAAAKLLEVCFKCTHETSERAVGRAYRATHENCFIIVIYPPGPENSANSKDEERAVSARCKQQLTNHPFVFHRRWLVVASCRPLTATLFPKNVSTFSRSISRPRHFLLLKTTFV